MSELLDTPQDSDDLQHLRSTVAERAASPPDLMSSTDAVVVAFVAGG